MVAKLEIVELKNDIVTASGCVGFDSNDCPCYIPTNVSTMSCPHDE